MAASHRRWTYILTSRERNQGEIEAADRPNGWLEADAEALIRGNGAEAYGEPRRRECDVILPDGPTHAGRTAAHWRRVALIVARKTGKRVGLDTATRMLERGDGVGGVPPVGRQYKRGYDDSRAVLPGLPARPHLDLPSSRKIVFVEKPLRGTEPEQRQWHGSGVIAEVRSADIGNAVISAMDAKAVQMIVIPPHEDLDHPVQLGNR